MTTLRLIGNKIATGTLTVAAMASVDPITSWTRQSDQVLDWIAPRQTTVPAYPQEVTTLNGKVSGIGFVEFSWTFSWWSFGQLSYFLTNFLTTSSVVVRSKACTVLTYSEINTAIYFNTTVLYPTYKQQVGGWADVELKFISSTQIT